MKSLKKLTLLTLTGLLAIGSTNYAHAEQSNSTEQANTKSAYQILGVSCVNAAKDYAQAWKEDPQGALVLTGALVLADTLVGPQLTCYAAKGAYWTVRASCKVLATCCSRIKNNLVNLKNMFWGTESGSNNTNNNENNNANQFFLRVENNNK